MIEFNGINGANAPARPGSSNLRRVPATDAAATSDAAAFSPQSAARSEASRLARIAEYTPDVRAELVEKAREEIIEGTYRIQEIVEQVAARLTRFLD